MNKGLFVVEGGIDDISEKILKNLKEIALMYEVSAGIKVKNRILTLNKKKDLLRAEVTYEMKL